MTDARTAEAGVTLIEVLVVLALIGVSAGIVAYALPSPAPTRTVLQEAMLLTSRLNLAAERSLMDGRHYTLDWQAGRYTFLEWQSGEWQSAIGAPLSEQHDLARGATLSDDNGTREGTIQISPDLLPGAEGVVQLWLEAGAERRLVVFDGASAGLQP